MAGTGAFGSDLAPDVGNAGGIQSLKDLGDYTKTANPGEVSGFTGDLSSLATKFKDMGAGQLVDARQAEAFFGGIEKIDTPLTNAAHPTLNSLITGHQSVLDGLTGSGNGPKGLPDIRDFAQHVGGGPDVLAFVNAGTANVATIAAFSSSITKATNLWATAGVDLTSPPPNTLGTSMTFATSLHKFGADTSGSGVASMLKNMANTSTKYGEAIKASLAEGKNNKLLSANGMGPLKTNPFEGLPSQDPANPNAAAQMLGGGSPTPPPSGAKTVGYSTDSGAFGSESTKGQVGTGTAGLKGTPFDLGGGM